MYPLYTPFLYTGSDNGVYRGINIDCGYLLEPFQRGFSNVYPVQPTINVFSKKKKEKKKKKENMKNFRALYDFKKNSVGLN